MFVHMEKVVNIISTFRRTIIFACGVYVCVRAFTCGGHHETWYLVAMEISMSS